MTSSQLSPRGAVLMGIVFVLAGSPPILIGAGVITPTGVDPTTPPWVPICAGLMTSVFGWVAFGSGPRRFSTTLALPFLAQSWVSGENVRARRLRDRVGAHGADVPGLHLRRHRAAPARAPRVASDRPSCGILILEDR